MKTSRITSKLKPALACLALLIGTISFPAAAYAGDSQEDYSAFMDYLDRHGVAEEVADSLLEKLDKQIPLDSMTLLEEPVATSEVETASSLITVNTFPDGSISTTELEKPGAEIELGVSPLAVAGCSVSSYTGVTYYTNCNVTGGNGIVEMAFRANMTIQHYGNDIIENAGYAPGAWCSGGSCPIPVQSGYKRNETSPTSPAFLIYSTTFTAFNNSFSDTYYLTLRVGQNQRTSTFG